ncbi:tRNA-splicing endonuclease subunit sen54 [Maudiozyma exigua]|uniref:tRNA-splicing endonuclease subunit sen54 n=1 Tax=Maudiozyma exigua TaxID=34358 RepID=A0A9P6WAM1_MAUEX|nr:tRNA-splicing endonuclease subunit sen54 [Kazachstania exigua]
MTDLNKNSNQPEIDLEEDEIIQDWSTVSKFTNDNPILSIPKRGEKDYEPDNTNTQEILLYRAQKAMFDTLENSIRGTIIKNQVKAYYIHDRHVGWIPHAKGNFVQTMGETDKEGTLWLHYFEFLYLAERGTITPFWKTNNGIEIPLSIEDLYSFFKNQKEMDDFAIYGYLKRLGFIVKSTNDCIISQNKLSFYPSSVSKSHCINILQNITSIFNKTYNSLFNGIIFSQWHFSHMKYTSSPQIYMSLNRLISYNRAPNSVKELHHDYQFHSGNIESSDKTLQITFNVWKPNPTFKKKFPELPDFQIVTYNKNINDQKFPTYKDLQHLFQSLNYKFNFLMDPANSEFWNRNTYINDIQRQKILDDIDNNPRNKGKLPKKDTNIPENSTNKKQKPKRELPPHIQQLKRLKNGYRSFLLAIMDNGIVSFSKISEADFGSENVWYVPPADGQKKPVNNRKRSQKNKTKT